MTYYDENFKKINEPDLSTGHVEQRERSVLISPETTKDVVINSEYDLHALETVPAEYKTETYNIFIPYTTSEQIEKLKAAIAASDYKAIKYAEGWLTEEEYLPIKTERQALRDKINELEALYENS